MAKFLPFVVEKSTPLHTYQTIIARSKGMNQVLVASIFWLILDKGITAIRETASGLPDNLGLDKLYEQILNGYPAYRVPNEDFKAFQLITPHMEFYAKDRVSAELLDYEWSDIMSFLLVMMYMSKLTDYTTLHLENLQNGQAAEQEYDLADNNLFSSEGVEHNFETLDELAAYVWFHGSIFISDIPPVKAVYIGTGKANGDKKSKRGKTRFSKEKTTYTPDWVDDKEEWDKSKTSYGHPTPNNPLPPSASA